MNHTPRRLQRIAVAGEIGSENLGDIVIADTLSHILCQELGKAIDKVALTTGASGDKEAPDPAPEPRSRLSPRASHRMLYRNSRVYRRGANVGRWLLHSTNEGRRLREEMNDADCLLIGGGQLLMDNDLVFPLHIFAAVEAAADTRIPVGFCSCGVGRDWSWIGNVLIRKVLQSKGVRAISVRDSQSLQRIADLGEFAQARVIQSADPALWAADVYSVEQVSGSSIVGLGIMAPQDLRRRANGKRTPTDADLRDFWADTAMALIAKGLEVRLFTNGSRSDYSFAKTVAAQAKAAGAAPGLSLEQRPLNGRELVESISQFRGVVAHRLHAHIISFSLGIPSVGMIWDDKVAGFAEDTERREFFTGREQLSAGVAAEMITWSLNVRQCDRMLQRLKLEAVEGVKCVLDSCEPVSL